jgi:hypothetical protein
MVSALLLATSAQAGTHNACSITSRSERLKHIGETITFTGEYGSDIERALVLPDGCPWGVGVGTIAPEAEIALEAFQGKPTNTVHGAFTGTLVRGAPNGFEFYKDDGTRLNITRLADPSPGKRKL